MTFSMRQELLHLQAPFHACHCQRRHCQNTSAHRPGCRHNHNQTRTRAIQDHPS